MRNFPVLLLMILSFTCAFSNNANHPVYLFNCIKDTIPVVGVGHVADAEKIFEKVETEASFVGGIRGWRQFLETNLNPNVPVKKKAPAGVYEVMVQFIVDKSGKISDIKALTSHGFGMEEEVIRVLRKSPRWLPAVQDGRKVKAYRRQPISFSITEK
ncbi:MAG TPA: energy transducer TonB [Chitinophagaceae bacterium]|nr:energy transducer TonB [Chitinophagaceae bacterium]